MNKICQNVVKKDSWYPLIKHHVPLCYVVNVKSTWKISSIFVVLLENMNFNNNYLIECCQTDWRLLCIIYMSVGKEHMTFESYGVLASIMLFMWTNNGNLFQIFTLHNNTNFREFKPKHVKFYSQTRNCFLGLEKYIEFYYSNGTNFFFSISALRIKSGSNKK